MREMESKRCCPSCGHELHSRSYLMAVDPDAPGFAGLLRGEGEDRLLNVIARTAALLIVFGAAVLVFWALGLSGS